MTIMRRALIPDAPGCMRAEIVLRHIPHNKYHPYVTHQHNIIHGDNDGFYWGHYFSTLADAYKDYYKRVREKGAIDNE